MFKSKAGQEFLTKMSWVADLLIISILWFLFSIPIITVGASSSAMYRAIQYRLLNGDGKIWDPFWKTFKSSFSQATVTWLGYVMLVVIFVLNQSLLASGLASSWINHFSQVFLIVMLLLITPILIMSLAYLARFEDNLKIVWKNTFLLSIAHFKQTAYIFFVVILSVSIVYLIPLLVVFIPAFSISRICPRLEKIFNKYTEEDLLGDPQ